MGHVVLCLALGGHLLASVLAKFSMIRAVRTKNGEQGMENKE